jgi:hypothetical protein
MATIVVSERSEVREGDEGAMDGDCRENDERGAQERETMWLVVSLWIIGTVSRDRKKNGMYEPCGFSHEPASAESVVFAVCRS